MQRADAARTARLGGSRVEVTTLGLGTAPLGGLYSSVADADATDVVRGALAGGVGLIDTAPYYGHGTAERRVGAALADVDRSSYVLSTKVGRLVVEGEGHPGMFADAPPSAAVFDFSAAGVRRSVEESLERLALDRVDILLIHDPDDHEDEAIGTTYPVLHELRDAGVVGAIGVGMNQSRIPTRFVRETDIDCVLLAGRWTLLDRSGGADLLPACTERGVSVIIGGVYNSGLLADPRPGATYDYATAPPALVEEARRLRDLCASFGVDLKAAALQFPLRHPAVASVLMGARSVGELEENLAMMQVLVPEELWAELEAEEPSHA